MKALWLKWVKICRRYWLLPIVILVLVAVIPEGFLILNPVLGGEVAKNEYIRTESIEKCLLLYYFNHTSLTKSQQLTRIYVYKYTRAVYYKLITMSIAIIVILMVGTVYLLTPGEVLPNHPDYSEK